MRLSAKQSKALEALIITSTNEEAAVEAGISRSTLQRYLNDPVFRAELEKHREDSVVQTNMRLIGAAATAVQTLEEIMIEGNSELARVQAASQVLQLVYKSVEHESITEQRILKNQLIKLQIDGMNNTENVTTDEKLTRYFEGIQSDF